MKRTLLILLVIFGLSAGVHAQSFGIGLGFSGMGGSGGLSLSIPLEFNLVSFGDIGISLWADVGLVFSQKPALTALITPLVTYTLTPVDFLPVTLYAGPTVQLFVQDVFEDSRVSSWSFLGGLAGASVSVAGFLNVFLEASLSVVASAPAFSVQAGVRL